MRILAPVSARQVDIGLFGLRVAAGTVFAAHGAQKLFSFGFDGVASAFGGMGVPFAGIVGPAVALLEFFGGIALVVGLLTRVVGFGLAANMLGAILLVHLPNGLFLPKGSEFALMLLAAATTLTITGAGSFSLDSLINRSLASRKGTAVPVTAVPSALDTPSRRIA
ncbi:MAG: DoxX family protein [Gemmatimonas sp.]